MYIIRDIFYLKFGHYKDAKALLAQAIQKGLLPDAQHLRALSDFTGDAYRLIFEEGYSSMTDYEKSLEKSMGTQDWQRWYDEFKPHVDRSYREILKVVV